MRKKTQSARVGGCPGGGTKLMVVPQSMSADIRNFRKLPFRRNQLNVFDKLNAPQTRFTTLAKSREWFNEKRFVPDSISIRKYAGVSYYNPLKNTI